MRKYELLVWEIDLDDILITQKLQTSPHLRDDNYWKHLVEVEARLYSDNSHNWEKIYKQYKKVVRMSSDKSILDLAVSRGYTELRKLLVEKEESQNRIPKYG